MALNITQFMMLTDNEKQRFLNHVDSETFFDVRVFTVLETKKLDLACEVCQTRDEKLYGTSDEREPKFCRRHYVKQNLKSVFKQAE